MAIAYKVLGQSAPAATTNTDLYTTPTGKSTIVSTLTVCNRAGTSSTFRVAVRPAGAVIANQHYVSYDSTVAPNDTLTFTLGITLASTDVLTVYASTTNLTFNLYGSEIS
jgi:hypothetical protein